MFLGNEEVVYLLDKAEGNAAQVNGHPAWGASWRVPILSFVLPFSNICPTRDIKARKASVMDVRSNTFCASGMHLPNGSYVTFGGSSGLGRGGAVGSSKDPAGNGVWDSEYQDFDGLKSIRILNPCTSPDNLTLPSCQWYDDPSVLSMQKRRWYSAAEALADGSVVMIGGFVIGGYVNRNFPNTDPAHSGGAAEPTYEFYPANGRPAQDMKFMITTS